MPAGAAAVATIYSVQVLEEYPEPTDIQSIVKVVCPRGNNLHEATWPDGKTALCSMPPKYRNRVWIKRNDFMIVEPIEEGDKVAAEIVNILLPPQIRHLKVKNLWPPEFVQQDPRGERATGKAKAGHGGKGGAATVASSSTNDHGADDAASSGDAATTDVGSAAATTDAAAAATADTDAGSAAGTAAANDDGSGAVEVESAAVPAPDDSESEDDMSDLVANNNRRYFEEEPDDDEETESESEDEAEL